MIIFEVIQIYNKLVDNIGLIYKTCDIAGIPFLTPDNVPADDINVWNSIRDDTTMIFQWESDSATAYLRQLFSDSTIKAIRDKNPDFSYMDLLSIGNGAIRPAGASYRDQLSKGIYKDNGHEALNEFMKPTLGFCVFQEEVIEFLHKFCGFTMGEADVVRRCVDENTLITMADGTYKKIKDVEVGDKVVTFDKSNSAHINEVEKVFDNGYKDCISVSTEHGNNIVMTPSHRVLTQSGWVEAKDLSLDDYIMTPKRLVSVTDNLRPNQRLSKTDMFLIGAMIGDGCVGGDYFHFTNADTELIDYVKHCINNRTRNKEECEFRLCSTDGVTVDKVYSLHIASKSYYHSCKNLFRKYGLCEFAQNKHIPKELMVYPMDEKLLSLLGGLFSTDAGVIKQTESISYYSTSKRLIDDIRYLLLRLGIYSAVYTKNVAGYDYYSYELNISQKKSLEIFKSKIYPYVVGVNREAYSVAFLKIYNKAAYNYLFPPEYVNEARDAMLNVGFSFNEFGVVLNCNTATDTKMRSFVNYVYAPKSYELLMAEYIPVRINRIERAGERHVYDLQIAENHNYIANNLIVHNCFAKKTGTEQAIPVIKNGGYLKDKNGNEMKGHYIKGFINTMMEEYGVATAEEAEAIGESFLQVIKDASDYLFSKNHSDPYSWIGYICGYLRYYYPLEFISTALNIFEDKADKTVAIIEYAKKRSIKISAIKFRFSQAKYSFDKETNQIFKGLASIKGLNAKIAEEMYALKDNTYASFIDLAYDLKYKTSLNSAQLRTLILLDFFSEFGECNLLLAQNVLFERFYNKKQIKKDILAEYSISEEMARNNAAKETAKMFAFDNMRGFLLEVVSTVRAKPRTLAEKLKDQNQLLGYVDVRGEQYKGIALVMEVNTKYSPRLKMYSLKNGNTVDCKIPKKTFNKQQVKAGDLLIIQGQERRQKTRRAEDGEFVPIAGEYDIWVTKYKKTTI